MGRYNLTEKLPSLDRSYFEKEVNSLKAEIERCHLAGSIFSIIEKYISEDAEFNLSKIRQKFSGNMRRKHNLKIDRIANSVFEILKKRKLIIEDPNCYKRFNNATKEEVIDFLKKKKLYYNDNKNIYGIQIKILKKLNEYFIKKEYFRVKDLLRDFSGQMRKEKKEDLYNIAMHHINILLEDIFLEVAEENGVKFYKFFE